MVKALPGGFNGLLIYERLKEHLREVMLNASPPRAAPDRQSGW